MIDNEYCHIYNHEGGTDNDSGGGDGLLWWTELTSDEVYIKLEWYVLVSLKA